MSSLKLQNDIPSFGRKFSLDGKIIPGLSEHHDRNYNPSVDFTNKSFTKKNLLYKQEMSSALPFIQTLVPTSYIIAHISLSVDAPSVHLHLLQRMLIVWDSALSI